MLYLITTAIALVLTYVLVTLFNANKMFGPEQLLVYSPFLLLLIPYFIDRRKRKEQFKPVRRD